MLLNNIFSCARAESLVSVEYFIPTSSIIFEQVGHLQNELERERQEERQTSEHRIKELQAQVEKLKLGRGTTAGC